MRIAYLDCASGISGDMMLSALIDAGADLQQIDQQIRTLDLPDAADVRLTFSQTRKNGFRSGRITISHPVQHAHRHLRDIQSIIATSTLSDAAKDLANQIFAAIGQAEATVHGVPIEKVHFHEVGAIDSIVDILGVAIAIDQLKIDRFLSSPVPTGSGKILIDHGEVSVPAPATALLLKQIPIQRSNIQSELTTPTGAAFLHVLVDEFGSLPSMKTETIGVGCGTKDFDSHANILRIMIGHADADYARQSVTSEPSGPAVPTATDPKFPHANYLTDTVVELQCNLDDVTGEVIGHCAERLRESGALDVWTSPIAMKKNRPGTLLSVLAAPATVRRLEEIIFIETQTLGIRRQSVHRTKLPRDHRPVSTRYGNIDVKMAQLPDGSWAGSPEFESCRIVAERTGCCLRSIYDAAVAAMLSDSPWKPDKDRTDAKAGEDEIYGEDDRGDGGNRNDTNHDDTK